MNGQLRSKPSCQSSSFNQIVFHSRLENRRIWKLVINSVKRKPLVRNVKGTAQALLSDRIRLVPSTQYSNLNVIKVGARDVRGPTEELEGFLQCSSLKG